MSAIHRPAVEPPPAAAIDDVLDRAFREDLGEEGDVTTRAVFGPEDRLAAVLVAKAAGVVAGLPVAERAFRRQEPELVWEALSAEGASVRPGERLARLEGRARGLLAAERTALNLLGHLSGVATATAAFVAALRPIGARLLDTRKTLPGLRALEKYAVRVGGGTNHRMGLFDMVLVKDNHIDAAGGIGPAVRRIRAAYGRRFRVEVEARTLDDVAAALEAGVDRILLDNMDDATLGEALAVIAGRVETEVSGNVTLERIRTFRERGLRPDFVSVGAITSSAPALDVSMRVVAEAQERETR